MTHDISNIVLYLRETDGDIVKVKVLEVDKQGRVRLSMKAVQAEEA
mgnify:CR=1 FL=1